MSMTLFIKKLGSVKSSNLPYLIKFEFTPHRSVKSTFRMAAISFCSLHNIANVVESIHTKDNVIVEVNIVFSFCVSVQQELYSFKKQ